MARLKGISNNKKPPEGGFLEAAYMAVNLDEISSSTSQIF